MRGGGFLDTFAAIETGDVPQFGDVAPELSAGGPGFNADKGAFKPGSLLGARQGDHEKLDKKDSGEEIGSPGWQHVGRKR